MMNVSANARRASPRLTATSPQRGASLIEILVAVLILSLGFLGMAGLQANALKKNQSSLARSQAVMFGYYIMDAMRADRSGALAGTYNTAATGICDPAALLGTSLADNTRKDWLQRMRGSLGDTASTCGIINCDNTGICTVTIRWNDERAGGLGTQDFVTRSRL